MKSDGDRARSSQLQTPWRWAAAVVLPCVVAIAVSLLVGGLTSFGQTLLPGALRGFANSSSGWTLITAVIVFVARRATGLSTVLGLLSFVALPIGYSAVSGWRGYPFDPDFWAVVGLIVGPFVGAAASWLHRSGWRLALGAGLLSGIALGESLHGFIRVIGTVGPGFPAVLAVLGTVLLAWTSYRLRRTKEVVLSFACAAAIAGGLFSAYGLIASILSSG